ncbi:MAG TPA: tail fiber domain-containing protein, partial [Candidatus Sumerlaeota bacterium]|nr:tail fiber domain-containing protein [Candidatus Sumerlaeota bacterium]
GVYGQTSGASGSGVYGKAMNGTTNYGGFFESSGTSGRAVYGEATVGGDVTNYGGYFVASGNSGQAVFGEANSGTGSNYGGYFLARGTNGVGVRGKADKTGVVTNCGGDFESAGNFGIGVLAKATATGAATNFGGHFTAAGNSGEGVHGYASSKSGTNIGVYGDSASADGRGVCGKATATGADVDNYGGIFEAAGQTGRGVYAYASATSGVNYGVRGRTDSPNGYAAYFTGAVGSTNYFQRPVGMGRTSAANMLEVEGTASKAAAGDWLANSDARIKTNVQTVSNALETLDKVRLVDFEYTEEYRQQHPGLEARRYMNVIAQEFAKVFPDYVKGSGEKLPNGEEILQVDSYPLAIYSAAALQELHKKVQKKEAKIAELEKATHDQQKKISSLEIRLAALEAAMTKK